MGKGRNIMNNEFETIKLTVGDYLHARDLMVEERGRTWRQYEQGHFENDELGELVEAYDFVADTLTWLAMELDRKNNK